MLECYFDDSGTHDGSKVVAWGGILGTTEEISKLSDAWQALLANPLEGKPPLRQFHLAHCRNSWGEFANYKPAERDAVRFAFRSAIVYSGVECFSAAVSVKDWDRIITGEARNHFGTAEQCAMSECIRFGLQFASNVKEREVSLVFDQGRMQRPLVERVELVRHSYVGFSRLVNIGFSPVDQFIALQAADTIAAENYAYALQWLEDSSSAPRPHFQSLLNQTAGKGVLIDEEEALRNLANYQRMKVKGSL